MKKDQPKNIRTGEELDESSLTKYLDSKLGLKGALKIAQFPSGFSNLTYLVKLGDKEMILRRPPFGANIKSAHDMSREYRFLKALKQPFQKVPTPINYCEDESVIGSTFYLMERVDGTILRGFMRGDDIPPPEQMASIAKAAISTLISLHKIDIKENDLKSLGKPDGYVQRQVDGWINRYRKSQTDEISEVENIISWLSDDVPVDQSPCVIHNDFKYDNLVLDPDDPSNVKAVLDWEMATIGDPLMDLGTTLGYWIEPSDPDIMKGLNLSPSFWPGNPSRQQVLNLYEEEIGLDIKRPLFYYIYGLFKIAVIVQQIFFRFKNGFTKDERFANLIQAVRACGLMATKAIDRDRISE